MLISSKNILLLMLAVFPMAVYAQQSKIQFRDRLGDSLVVVNTAVKPPKVKGPSALRGELSGGLRLSTDGYGIFVDKGWIKGDAFPNNKESRFYHVRLLQVELSERKHPKEMKTNSAFGGLGLEPSSYILGKINNFYTLRVGYGRRQMIAGKPDPGTVAVHWVYVGGLSLGLVKPYYLELQSLGTRKYTDSIINEFTSEMQILGKASFTKGFNELKFVPGAYVKSGLHFDFANKRKGLMALEVGASAELYIKKVEQMVLQEPKAIFFNFYGSFQLGKRW